MHKIEVPEANITFDFPESALEFNQEQTILFSKLLLLYQSGQITFKQLQIHLTYHFLNLKRRADFTKSENNQVAENIYQIGKLVKDYFTEYRENEETKYKVKMDFYIQKIPKLTVDGIEFYGPTDALFNTVYGEYLQVMNHFTEFSKTKSLDDLDAMVATIYRPQKDNYKKLKTSTEYDGDIRKKFNANLTANYVSFISKLDLETKYAIYLYVASCQHFIANCSALDIGGGNSIDLSQLFNGDETEANGLGMLGTLFSLAETKAFGNIKEVAEQNTYDVFAYLVKQSQDYKKLKKNART
ncbi:hypothetical protein [Winogradskyella sp.]|uniref:hypothetical protein n=1 Tax=Winogradskyella sp. TaxID=1883156 RepID=UPI003BAB3350